MVVNNLSNSKIEKIISYLKENKISFNTDTPNSIEIPDDIYHNLGFHKNGQLQKLGFIPDINESIPNYYKDNHRGFENFRKIATKISKVLGVLFGLGMLYSQFFK